MYEKSLSIIVPIYNSEKYLRYCIDSILIQSYRNIEIILVDDGSTDESSVICDEYVDTKRVRVIHRANGGANSARKSGLDIARGEYIGFVDADDWVEPNMYEFLMCEAHTHSADVVSCGYYLDNNDSGRVVRDVYEKNVLKCTTERKEFFRGILAEGFDWSSSRNISPSVCNKIFRKSLLDKVYSKIDDRVMWDEDTITVLSAVLDSECIVMIPDILYHYRQNMSSMSHKVNRSVLQNYVYSFDELHRISSEHDGILDDQIPFFSLTAMRTALEVGFGVESGKQYLFPFDKVAKGSKVIIYGAGQVGRSYYSEVSSLEYAAKVLITDSNPNNRSGVVISPDEVFKQDHDVVLIAVENETTAGKIKESLIKRGVSESKIFWQKPTVLKDTYSFRVNNRNQTNKA